MFNRQYDHRAAYSQVTVAKNAATMKVDASLEPLQMERSA